VLLESDRDEAGVTYPAPEEAPGAEWSWVQGWRRPQLPPGAERGGKAVTVALPYGMTALCPVRALRRWQAAAGISEGALFRRIWVPPTRRKGDGPLPSPVVGTDALDSGSIARIVKRRAAAAGYDRNMVAGHSLKRGAMTTGMDQGVHPTKLKRLGRHKSYNVLDEYLEAGDPFEGHPLGGVL